MGLYLIIFQYEKYAIIERKCQNKSIDEWNSYGTSNLPLGIFYALIGVVGEVTEILEGLIE